MQHHSYGYGMAQNNGYRSFRGDPDAWNEWATYSRTCWEGILSWPVLSTTCHCWIWIKGINHILGDVWIMGMHRGHGSHVGPGYGSEPYILSHGQYQSYHSQRLSPRRDAPSGSKIHQSPLKHWGTLPTWAVFSRMRSKDSRFTLGVWGLRVCSLDVAFTFATVRNRSQTFAWGPYGRAYGKFCRRGPFWRFQTSRCFVSHGKFCRRGPFWRFQTCRCFVSHGRRGTSWHSDVFCNVSKVVLCGMCHTFVTFSQELQFSWQVQHFGRVHRHFTWQGQHFRRVVLRVFCESHWQGCVKWRQGADSVVGVAFCEMCWKLTEASHETSIFR